MSQEEPRTREREEREREMELEDMTCCHRVTICHPLIRETMVTEPVSRHLGRSFTWAKLFHLTTSAGLATLGWAVLYSLLGDTMLPKNDGFGLYALLIFSSWLGASLSSIPYLHLPPVFGMLVAGMIVGNSGLYHIREGIGVATASKIRTFCLTFIMIRVGLRLSTTSLKMHPIFLMLLAVVPSTMEWLALAMCCKGILSYRWDWSFMAGTVLSCMSPVMTVNCVLALVEQGYGDEKGIVTILCTASCFDSVHILSVFSVCYTIVFTDDQAGTEWWYYVPSGLRDTIMGVLVGASLGVCFVFFPHRSHKYASWCRMTCLVLGSLMCTTAAANLTISGGGYLASLVMSFVAMIGWKILSPSFDTEPFRRAAHILWQIAQPILVGVIGANIELAEWSPTRFFLHLLCIALGLMVRSITAYLLTLRTTFTLKQRLFVVVCWLPKGTLQAALGPMAYERLRNQGDYEQIEMALDLVRISVLTIVFMAPIGAALITLTGPILLDKLTDEQRERDREFSYLQLLSLLPTPQVATPKTHR